MAETFELLPWRFRFRALEPVRFPAGKAANVFRGALGLTLRALACAPECPGPANCARTAECAYARLFEPVFQPGAAPSGFANPPRPFALRAAHLDGVALPPGAAFHLDLHLFETRYPALSWFERAFDTAARSGIGPGRGRAALEGIDSLAPGPGPLVLPLDPEPRPVPSVLVTFVTPTELKSGGALAAPGFSVLFARIRDRISALRTFYGSGPLAVDFGGLALRAAQVSTTGSELSPVKASRFSSRTRASHPLDGFTGRVEYSGALAEFVPWLRAAAWTGVGRQTVWGHGAIEVTLPSPPASS